MPRASIRDALASAAGKWAARELGAERWRALCIDDDTMKNLVVIKWGIVALPLALSCAGVQQERGPAIVVTGQGPVAERVQAQVGVVDAKLSAVEQLCRGEGMAVEGRCFGPLRELNKKKAYYRQRAHALLKTADTDSAEDVADWHELEIELEMLTSEVDELADDVKHPPS